MTLTCVVRLMTLPLSVDATLVVGVLGAAPLGHPSAHLQSRSLVVTRFHRAHTHKSHNHHHSYRQLDGYEIVKRDQILW